MSLSSLTVVLCLLTNTYVGQIAGGAHERVGRIAGGVVGALVGVAFALGMIWFERQATRNQGTKAVVPLSLVCAVAIAAPCLSGVVSVVIVRVLSKAVETFWW